MQDTQGRMREAVEAIQAWLFHNSMPGEAVVRQAIVLRVLHAAGFDIWNPAEVVPEETNQSKKRADLMIRVGQGAFALELKGMNANFQPADYQQVVGYAGNKSMRWAMLTNGKIWIVMDRKHNPTGTFQDHEVLKLVLNQEGHTFADDLTILLDAETWRADAFAAAVEHIKSRQEQRKLEKQIFKEKAPVVEAFQKKHNLPSFESAVAVLAEFKQITEAERDVLLGVPAVKTLLPIPSKKVGRQTSTPMLQPFQSKPTPDDSAQEVHFTYRFNRAKANAIYRPDEGTWTVKAGSTCIPEGKSYAKTAHNRRGQLLAEGKLIKQDDYLVYAVDVVYQTPSAAADDISGASKNGWDVWKDDQDRPAQYHRPKPQPT